MTFMEKAHREIQLVDLVMIVVGCCWLIFIVLDLIGAFSDAWFLHLLVGACWFLWAAGFYTRWNNTGVELKEASRDALLYRYSKKGTFADRSSSWYDHE